MINILSYVGMTLQSEVCLWTLLGLVRTIFDATLFKVNANLKQVWQMSMPAELSLPVQRVVRTMISGIMLVQCFTVYVYLASYIVLLYPVFLEERPALLLPWLLLAAIRKLLCELTSLAIGLGTCVLLGPARPPCIKFVVIKVISIMPVFYMWMLIYSYYHALKVALIFKTFPDALPSNDRDYGLELAVRRRRTKSLFGEEQLRRKIIANFYNERTSIENTEELAQTKVEFSKRTTHSTDTDSEDTIEETHKDTQDTQMRQPVSMSSNRLLTDITLLSYEDWFGSEIMVRRDSDRILEQFGAMMLRIAAFQKKRGSRDTTEPQIMTSVIHNTSVKLDNLACAVPSDDTDTPPLVGMSSAKTASYLRNYPQIFMKRISDVQIRSDLTITLSQDSNINRPERGQTRNENKVDAIKPHESLKYDSKLISSSEKATSSKKVNLVDINEKKVFDSSDESKQSVEIPSRDFISDSKNKETQSDKNTIRSRISDSIDGLESILNDIKIERALKRQSLGKDENKRQVKRSSSKQLFKESGMQIRILSSTSVVQSEATNSSDNYNSDKAFPDETEKKK